MRDFRDLSRLIGLAVGLLLGLVACIGPDQTFPPHSALWEKANPPWVGATRVDLAQQIARHHVLVAVLDGGMDYNAPSLQRAIHPFAVSSTETSRSYGLGWDTLGKDYFPHYSVLNPATGEDVSDDLNVFEHGTHVSQLVALTHPGIGLLPIRVLPLTMTAEEDRNSDATDPRFLVTMAYKIFDRLEEGLTFASNHGAAIVNMSLGVSLEEIPEDLRGPVMARLESQLIAPMRSQWSRMLFVVAAGNEGEELTRVGQVVPATLPIQSLLCVGALKDHHTISSFSNHGKFVDVYVRGSEVTSTIPGGARKKLDGTSMAAPLVAHLAAELKILLPQITPPELRALILNTSDEKVLVVEPGGKRRLVRVLNMRKARQVAKLLANGQEPRARWLVAPFERGQSREEQK